MYSVAYIIRQFVREYDAIATRTSSASQRWDNR